MEQALDAAAAGAGHLVVVSGGIGTGKSTLLMNTRARAADKGFTILSARGSYLERELPFAIAGRLFEPEDVELPPRARTDTLAEPGPVTLPELHALHRALAQLAHRPLLIVVDDVHHADLPSLQWLSTLPFRAEHLPVLVLVSVASGEGRTDALDELVAASAQEIRLDRAFGPIRDVTLGVRLRRISPDAPAALGDPDAPADLVARMHDMGLVHRDGSLNADVVRHLTGHEPWAAGVRAAVARTLIAQATDAYPATAAELAWQALELLGPVLCDELLAAQTVLVRARLDLGLPVQVYDGPVPDLPAAPAFLAARGTLTSDEKDLLECGKRLPDNDISVPWRIPLGGDHLDTHIALARQQKADVTLGIALRHKGVNDEVEGLPALEESVAVLDRTKATLERARSHAALGHALHLFGRVKQARAAFRTALDLAQDCETPGLVGEIRHELSACGGRGRRRAPAATGPAGLTESERRVAALAAEGKLNREIAAALFVQLRTVEIHLTKVYRKLGIRGRDQLAPALQLVS